MNDWDNLDNFPADDDDNDDFDWLNDDSDDFDVSDEDNNDSDWLDDDEPQEWQMPRPERAEKSIASQIEDAEDADFGNTDELLDWMSNEDDADTVEEPAEADIPDWLSGMDLPEVSEEEIASAQSEIIGNDDDLWGNTSEEEIDASGDDWGFEERSDEPEAEGDAWLASTGESEDEVDDFLFGAGSDDEDDADDFLFGAGSDDEDDADDFLFGAGSDDEDDADDFLFGAGSDDEDDADDFLFGASADDDSGETSHTDDSQDSGGWGDLGDFDFEDDKPHEAEPVAEDSGWGLSGSDDNFDFIDEPATDTSTDNDLGVPDWLSDMPVPGDTTGDSPELDDLAVPEWLADDDDLPAEATGDDDLLDMFDELDKEPVAEAADDDLLDLLGGLGEDSVDLGDLLATLDTEDDDGDLDDLLSSLDTEDEEVGLDDLFASVENEAPDDILSGDATIIDTSSDDLDFLDPVAEENNDLDFLDYDDEADEFSAEIEESEDLDFLEPVAEESDDLDFLGYEDEDEFAPGFEEDELAILNELSQSPSDEPDFIEAMSQNDEPEGFYQTDDSPDLEFLDEYETGEDVQEWFDSQDAEEEKPATGSLAYLDKVEQSTIDDDPDWLDEISGIDTDTLRDAAAGVGKPESVDLDALIDSFDIEDSEFEEDLDIEPGANLDDILGGLDSEQLSQLPDDLPAEALPEWLQEIQKGTTAESAAALLHERQDRSLDDMDDRLLDLRERGLEMSPTVSDESGSTERLSKVVPNIDEALSPVPMTPGQAAITTGLDFSPGQAKRADLLQNLVGTPGELTGDEADSARSSQGGRNRLQPFIQRVDRIIIGLLLVAVVVAPFVYPIFDTIGILPAGEFAEDSVEFAAFTTIEDLIPGSYVLVAAEYGATGARELDTATQSLLEHIIVNGGIPVIVSSDAVGLLRAENIIVDLAGETGRNGNFYIAGLVPGGSIGLRDFASNLTTFVNNDLRGNPIDLDVSNLDDFATIIIISESGENVRNWMEQIAPLTDTGIIVVTGQAARPLALPYVTSSDNTIALLTGYEDAFTYQQMSLGLYNPSDTPTPMATMTATDTATPLPSATPLPADTATATALPTDTPALSDTPEITATDISGLTPDSSNTPIPATDTAEPDSTNTATPENSAQSADATDTESTSVIEVAVISSESAANVREDTGTNFSIVASIEPGERLAVLNTSDDEDWYEVILPDGSTGWIAAILVNILEIPEDEFDGTSEVNANVMVQIGTIIGSGRVNIRSGPGSEFATVAGLEPGSQVRIIATNDAGDWYNIVLPNGEGWIAAFLLDTEDIPEDEWDGASKDGYFPVYFSRPPRVAQSNDETDILIIGRNAAGLTMPVYTDDSQSNVLLEIPNGTEFIVIEDGEPLTQILLEGGQIGFIETRIIVTEERERSEVEFAPTPAPPTATATMTPTFTPSPFAPQITPEPFKSPETRSSSQALGLVAAIVVIALGNLFWIFRWLGQRQR